MSQTDEKLTRTRYKLDIAIVGFNTAYLQTEADSNKAAAEIFEEIEKESVTKMVLSLDGVRFASSTMLAQIIKIHKTMAKAKGKLVVCCLAPSIRDVLRASQLDKLLLIEEDEPAALKKVSS